MSSFSTAVAFESGQCRLPLQSGRSNNQVVGHAEAVVKIQGDDDFISSKIAFHNFTILEDCWITESVLRLVIVGCAGCTSTLWSQSRVPAARCTFT